MIAILQHTPFWVYVLFLLLSWLGLAQTRTRQRSVSRLLLVPVIMVLYSFSVLVQQSGLTALDILPWLLGMAVSLLAMLQLSSAHTFQFSTDKRTVRVAGSWLPLVLIMGIFCIRYAVGVTDVIHPGWLHSAIAVMALSTLYGLFSGAFAGRAAVLLRARHTAQQIG